MQGRTGRSLFLFIVAISASLLTARVAAQPGETQAMPEEFGLWPLFVQSLDVFTVALLAGSLFAVAVIVRCAMDIRSRAILPPRVMDELDRMIEAGRLGEVREFTRDRDDFASVVVRAALREAGRGRDAMVDAAEIAASTQTSKSLRLVELLSLVGNLAPLVGLAGTVWGMILAFASLSATEGQAGPAELSAGISKALFHTLAGLVLAIPALLVAGVYRSAVERICGRGIAETARMVERLADHAEGKPS